MDNNMPDMAQLQALAESPAGQKLKKLLQQNTSREMKKAMEKAAAGDLAEAKNMISSWMQQPEIAELTEELRRQQHG